MSLAPHFFANMFPAWYFMSAGWSGLVWTAIIAIAFGKWMGIENLTRPKDFHDIGKLSLHSLCSGATPHSRSTSPSGTET